MYLNLRKYILLAFTLVVLSSCTSRKKLIYFRDINETTQNVTYKNIEVLKVNDLVEITVLSEDMNAARPYNNYSVEINPEDPKTTVSTKPKYLIDNEGNINFPQLGRLQIAGMSILEVETMLTEKLKRYIKDVLVVASIANFKVTLLGEFEAPGVIEVPEGRITIVEALAKAGGVTNLGKRNNILLIRSINGLQQAQRINLNKSDLFKSDYFYLQQNDILVAEPNGVQAFRAGGTGEFLQIFTILVSVGLSAVVILNSN